jgi:hypothetical protein
MILAFSGTFKCSGVKQLAAAKLAHRERCVLLPVPVTITAQVPGKQDVLLSTAYIIHWSDSYPLEFFH